MGTTPNRNLPYPENTDKLGEGDDAIKALATAVDSELIKVVPVSQGGTGATAKNAAKNNLGVSWGTGDPPANGVDGDIYFKLV